MSPVAAGDPAAALAVPGTKVFMKAGRQVEKLRDLLVGSGQAANASIVANCGLPDETVVRGLPAQGELPGYLSVTIVKDVPSTTSACPQPTQPHPALRDVARSIAPPVEAARKRAQAKWNAVAKPIGGLGVLEDDIVRIAALRGTEDVRLSRRAVAVLCADNGVAAEGVSQCGQEVTAAVAANIARGVSSVCKMAATARADAFACDLGMACPPATPGIVDLHVARGAGNIARGPAMSQEEALRAIYAGIAAAAMLQGQGYDIVAAGEMGIGNTTTSSAIAAVLLDLPAQRVVGRGAGLSDEGLQRKTEAVKRAIAANQPDRDDALDVLAKLGGFDIAGLVGLYLGCAMHRMPVVIDGFIGTLAAVVAARLVPACTVAMIASHVSAEPAARLLLGELGLQPAIDAGLHLGEGTGAVCLLPLLDAALALYNGTTFEETGIDAYEVHPQG